MIHRRKSADGTHDKYEDEDVYRLLVDMIQFLDRKGHSDTMMRWKVDAVLNYRYSIKEMYENFEWSIEEKKFIYGVIPTEEMD